MKSADSEHDQRHFYFWNLSKYKT